MKKTRKITLASFVALVLIAAAVTIKVIWFPSVNDAWFRTGGQGLRQVPQGLVIVRPTHFTNSSKGSSPQNQIAYATVNGKRRMVGINVTFQQLIATAYSYNPGRIVLPADAPMGNYDFLVTVSENLEARLQSAIRRKPGYTAQPETRDTQVLALKVEDANSPGLTISPAGEKQGTDFKNGRLYFEHQKLSILPDGLEQGLKQPVVDETGLTDFYDFSLVWDQRIQQQMQNGAFDLDMIKKILDGWGLGLEPDTASIEILVVEKVK